MTFPLDDRYEIYLGADLDWVDITHRVYTRDPVTITRGRADEASRPDPGELSLTLNNRDGLFSPRNPRSPYFGLLGRNTPIRASVNGPAYLRLGTFAGSTYTSSPPNVTGDLDVRVEATLDDWTPEAYMGLLSKADYSDRSWLLAAWNGFLHFEWSADGTTSQFVEAVQALPADAGDRLAVRATLEVNDGAGGHTVTFYTAPSLAGPWTSFGDPITGSGTTSVHASAADLRIGDYFGSAAPVGRYHALQVRDGVDGALLADLDFATEEPGATSFTDSAGLDWEMFGDASIEDRYYRFAGEVSYWPQRWDEAGRDVYTPIKAAGLLRRLGQGAKPLQSALRRRIPQGAPIAYWPMEDGEHATTAVSPTPGVLAPHIATFSYSSNKVGVEFAQDSSLVSSDALPTFDPTKSTALQFRVPTLNVAEGEWHVEMVYKLPEYFRGTNTILQVYTNGGGFNRIMVNFQERVGTELPNIRVQGDDRYSDPIDTTLIDVLHDYSGQWMRLQLLAQTDPAGVKLWLGLIPIGGAPLYWTTTYAGSVGCVDRVDLLWGSLDEGMPTLSAGHLAVFPKYTTIYDGADSGYQGETSVDRLVRLAGEEGIALKVTGAPQDSEALGPQTIATTLELLDEAVDADGGIFGEQQDALGLTYLARAALYNQPPAIELDYAARGEVMPPLEPVDDDQATRNDITIKRRGGSEARVALGEGTLSTQAPPDGVGVYDESLTLNLATDDQAHPIAGWRLHLGTWDEARYPTVHLALHAAPWLIPAVLRMRPGTVLTIANPPPWLPPDLIQLRVEGYTETIASAYEWMIELNCSPAGPWTVATLADAGDGVPNGADRADTDGSELDAPAAAGATEIAVTVTAGELWTADPAQMPFDIRVGGEVMRVTAATDGALPQTLTVERGVNGIDLDHPAGTDVRLAQPAYVAL